MTNTALAILMAAIAASHLRMHRRERDDDDDDCYDDDDDGDDDDDEGGGSPWTVLADAAAAAADLVLARRAWAAVAAARDDDDNDRDDDGEGGDPPIPDDASAGGGGDDDDDDTSSADDDAIGGCLRVLNEETTSLRFATTDDRGGRRLRGGVSNDLVERWNVAMHSFRIALKVAALATGRLVLPEIMPTTSSSTSPSSSSLNEEEKMGAVPPRERRGLAKVKKKRKIEGGGDEWVDPASRENDWNARYNHSCPNLCSRDYLVDALSFHSAAVRHPAKRRALIGSREACLDEAVVWEDLTGDSLLDYDHDSGDVGVATTAMTPNGGRAWKIRTCLHGLDIATDARRGGGGSEREADDDDDERDKTKTIGALELLASSSSSRFARDLLGCLRFGDGDPSRALESLQSSLDAGGGSRSHVNDDEETGEGVAERRNMANVALCLASMGDPDAPVDAKRLRCEHAWCSS
jgi:hypothetical protein